MTTPDGFLLRVLKSTPFSKQGAGQMNIIVPQQYANLISELRRVFKGQGDVNIKVDDRQGERRERKGTFSDERRQAERRRTKEILVEAVVSI
ncbi:MAG TPA: hypothetical protein ENI07_02645 [Desulfobacterales bacterium]|nr:hypothetical protein [Desulfobacterales bacterium]